MLIHNALSDVDSPNAGFAHLSVPQPPALQLDAVVGTLLLARRKHPGVTRNLDALRTRSGLTKAGARSTDVAERADSLVEFSVELLVSTQASFGLGLVGARETETDVSAARSVTPGVSKSRLTDTERERYAAFLATRKTPIWVEYIVEDADG